MAALTVGLRHRGLRACKVNRSSVPKHDKPRPCRDRHAHFDFPVFTPTR